MRPFILALFAILPGLLCAADLEHGWERWDDCTFVADEYFDGDSFHVRHGGQVHVLRLYGADAPETDAGYAVRVTEQAAYYGVSTAELFRGGEKAKEFTKRFLGGRFTVITRRKIAPGASRTDRLYAMVQRDGADLDAALIQAGLARATTEAADFPDAAEGRRRTLKLRSLEEKAAEERKGLWAASRRSDRQPSLAERLTPRLFKGDTLPKPHKVNVNTASPTDLEALPGIGEKIAEQIIRGRPIKGLDDLDRIPGIGPKKLEALRELVSF